MIIISKILVTSALPYIHGVPHLGNLVGSVLPADVYSRFLKITNQNYIYICGSDAHGTSYEIEAYKQNKTPEEIVNGYHKKVKEIFEKLNIDFTYYGSTHTEENKEITHRIFKELDKNGHLEEIVSKNPFCEKHNMFLFDRLVEGKCSFCSGLARGDQCNDCGKPLNPEDIKSPYCTLCESGVSYKETKHLYIKLNEFEDWIKQWYSIKKWSELATGETKSWLNKGLQSRRITGDTKWGFPVPKEGYENKVFYCWFDAPIGYIGITKEWADKTGNTWQDWWLPENEDDVKYIQFMGKDNTFFHSILFPSCLKGSGENWKQVDNIIASGWLISNDVKFSKSTGTGLTSEEALKIRPADYWRYTLMALYPDRKDSEFSLEEFQRRVNTELNDIFGNFILRTLTLINKKFDGKIPSQKELSENDKQILNKLNTSKEEIEKLYNKIELKEALRKTVEFGKEANTYINSKEPWREEDPSTTLNICTKLIHALGVFLYPIIPESSEKILNSIGIDSPSWNDIGSIKENIGIEKPKQLFNKIDDDELDQLKEKLETPKKGEDDMIGINDFKKVKLKVGKIESCEKVENSDKLLKLKVNAGDETRQIVSGIADFYDTEELIGKEIVFIANLEPAKIRGVESQGMILAAEDENGNVSVIQPDKTVQPGSQVV